MLAVGATMEPPPGAAHVEVLCSCLTYGDQGPGVLILRSNSSRQSGLSHQSKRHPVAAGHRLSPDPPRGGEDPQMHPCASPSSSQWQVEGVTEMTLFYRGPQARITHEVFESRCPSHQSYLIYELEYVHTVQEQPVRVLVASVPFRVCSTGMAGLSVALATTGWPILDRPSLTLVALAVLATSSAVSTVAWTARRRPFELRAVHRGQLVCIFQTTDRRTFGQVTRALLRVLERIEEAR
jgi:hypothetical protein